MNSREVLEHLEEQVALGLLSRTTSEERATKGIRYETVLGRQLQVDLGNAVAARVRVADGSHRLVLRDVGQRRATLTFEATPPGPVVDWSKAESIQGVTFREKHQYGGTHYTDGVSRLKNGAQRCYHIDTVDGLSALLTLYATGSGALNKAALTTLRKRFCGEFPDFNSFTTPGEKYQNEEDHYKRALVAQAAELIAAEPRLDDVALGRALLDLIGSKKINLLGYWKTYDHLAAMRAANPGVLEAAAGGLARSAEPPVEAVARFNDVAWPLISKGQGASQPYGDSRTIPTLLVALARPSDAIMVKTRPFKLAGELLRGRSPFGWNPLTPAEHTEVLETARAVFSVMRGEWGWAPRDLWDVQGFYWVTCQKQGAGGLPAVADEEGEVPEREHDPINLILYGPPGTGKTFATAERAVRLCGEDPTDRDTVMAAYRRLQDAGRIEFVTFHQSYGYEEFVEGLRPTTEPGDGDGEGGKAADAGFRLRPEPGVFRRIALLADQARRRPKRGGAFELGGRQVFKMSLGRAGAEEHIYDAAIAGGYAVLGWGGEVDWSDSKFDGKNGWQAIFDRWREEEPDASGYNPNVVQTWRFRTSMKPGDLVVVSEGNTRFRAIGEVRGPYRFDPTGEATYNHRRDVDWLLVLDEALPVELIYSKGFSQASCYLLSAANLKREALEGLLPGPGDDAASGTPDQFVLVIDEINRGNISKIFGELITLLEPDKRLGTPGALTVRLPYSKLPFGVPDNLHIVGTMNTADRSIALLDTALRRRFRFEELPPRPELLGVVEGVNLSKLLTMLNERIEYLFDREHRIGHAYLMGCETRDALDQVIRHNVIPLLAEYFFEDWSKIAAVLGDVFPQDGKEHQGGFLNRQVLPSPFAAVEGDDAAPRHRWIVREMFSYEGFE